MSIIKDGHFGAVTSKTSKNLYGFSKVKKRIAVFQLIPVCVVEAAEEEEQEVLGRILQELGVDLNEYLRESAN